MSVFPPKADIHQHIASLRSSSILNFRTRGGSRIMASKKAKGAELFAPPRLSLPIATVPVVASRVVRVAIVTTVVIRAPPAAAIGPTNPTYLLDFRRRIGRHRRDRHRRSCGHCDTATNCSSRKQERYFSHGHSSSIDAPLTRDGAGSFRRE